MPGIEQGQSLGLFAVAQRFVGMHPDAEGAAVDLRGAQLDQMVDRAIDFAGDRMLQLKEVLERLRRELLNIQSLCFDHFNPPALL